MKNRYSDAMFACAPFNSTCFSGISLNMQSAAGIGISNEARALTTVRGGNKAKISVAVDAVDRLFTGKMNVVSMENGCYAEIQTTSNGLVKAMYSNGSVHFAAESPISSTSKLRSITGMMLFAYAISNNTLLPITKEAFGQLKEAWIASAPFSSVDPVFELCDAFYYEYKAHVNNTDLPEEIEVDAFLSEDLVKQAGRTGKLKKTEALFGLELPDLSVSYEEEEDENSSVSYEEQFEVCKNGGYMLDYPWDLERRNLIPDLNYLDDFVPDPCFYSMTSLIDHELHAVKERMDKGIYDYRAIEENYINAQFIGRPGTGKTTIANALAATFGLPIQVVISSKNVEEDTFQGMTKVQEGSFKFVETPFLDAYKNGGIILLEEINLADPGVTMGVLGQALEKPFILLEDGYKPVRRHPMCVVIGTANTGTQGSREQSEALTSRMPHVFLMNDPEKEQFIEILRKKNPKVKKSDCVKVYTAYNKVLQYLTSSSVNAEDVALSLCIRHCIAALKQIEIGIPFKNALCNTIIGTIGIKDLELANATKEHVIDVLAG